MLWSRVITLNYIPSSVLCRSHERYCNTCTQRWNICSTHPLLPVLWHHFLCYCQVTGSKWPTDKLINAKLTDKKLKDFVNRLSSSSKPRLFWMTNKGKPRIPYNGVPFATASHQNIYCKTTSKMKRVGDASAFTCDAKIFCRGIWHFPMAVFECEPGMFLCSWGWGWGGGAHVCICCCGRSWVSRPEGWQVCSQQVWHSEGWQLWLCLVSYRSSQTCELYVNGESTYILM